MLRQDSKIVGTLTVAGQPSVAPPSRSAFTQCGGDGKAKAQELSDARKWLVDLKPGTIPEKISDVTYSRASGAGGIPLYCIRNVCLWRLSCRTNSKARLLTPLKDLLPLVPKPLHASIHSSRYYIKDDDSIIITSERSKRASKNRDDCLRKQMVMLMDIGKQVVYVFQDGFLKEQNLLLEGRYDHSLACLLRLPWAPRY